MKALLRYETKVGTFYIAQAVDDLVLNATFSVLHPVTSKLLDTSELGLPEDPGEWERVCWSPSFRICK